MFGVLMGTLQRFKQEEKQLSDKVSEVMEKHLFPRDAPIVTVQFYTYAHNYVSYCIHI